MKPKSYQVLLMAVEDGVEMGWARAYKYDETPADCLIKAEIIDGVLDSINEWFDFEDQSRESW